MPRGEYRDNGGWVLVNYEDRFRMRMHRSDYEDHDYKPPFEALPVRTARGANGSGRSMNGAAATGSKKRRARGN